MSVSENLNKLTRTFERDCAYCDELFQSVHAETVGELLLYHLWMTNAGPVCQKALSKKAASHFKTPKQAELRSGYTLLLSEGMKRDMCLVPYLVIRGLPSEAGMPLRRAFEHAGVLTHIWSTPEKVEALQDTSSRDYSSAFKKEFDVKAEKQLKALGIPKRFEAMKLGVAAKKVYQALSGFDVHGGTAREIEAWTSKTMKNTCGFCARPNMESEILGHRLSILTSGHKLLCGELIALVAQFCDRSEDLASAAQALGHLEMDGKAEAHRLLARLRGMGVSDLTNS